MNRSDYQIYVVTKPLAGGWEELYQKCEQIFQAGVKILQLRDKKASKIELITAVKKLQTLADKYQAHVIVNDRVDVASEAGAHGAHLGQSDLQNTTLAEARAQLGPKAIIGISVRTAAEGITAAAAGADYLGINGVFDTQTKTDLPGAPLKLEGLRQLCKQLHATGVNIPLVAIGGIKKENAAKIIEAGVDGVAIVSAIMDADNIAEACATLRQEARRGLELRRERETRETENSGARK